MSGLFDLLGTTRTQSPYQLARSIEDAAETANALWDQQHMADGTHGTITCDEIGPNATNPITVSAGLRITNGPHVFEQDDDSAPGNAVLRPDTITADQNNYAPTGINNAVVLEVQSDAARTITGISVLARVRRNLRIVNHGNFTITLAGNSSSSSVLNRFYFGGQDYALISGTIVDLYYDSGSGVWRGPSPQLSQVRTVFTQAISWANTGTNPSTQNFTLSKTLANASNAIVVSVTGHASGAAENYTFNINSTTNIQVIGDGSLSGTFYVAIAEYQNLVA